MSSARLTQRFVIVDRMATFGGIALLVGLSWFYTIAMPDMDRSMAEMAAMAEQFRPWSGLEAVFTLAMWIVMMVAMMTPSTLPMVVVFDRVARSRPTDASPFWVTGAFVLGYLALWTLFSVLATTVQAALHATGLLSPAMKSASSLLSGVLLIAAGAYQLSPLKHACLSRCRSPMAFLLTEWRDGLAGAFVMGWRHGVYCVGCCWLLMALLFVGGVMDLRWIASLSVIVLLEKTLPGARLAPVLGIGLAAWGVWLLAFAIANGLAITLLLA
jgi:predicted metal-binding membrane protein